MTVASDFDNTLYVKDLEILKENINSVKNFIDHGNIFIIITGRSYTNIKKVLTKYSIPYSYLVCQDGANIFNGKDECLKSNYLNIEKSKVIAQYLEKHNIPYSYESAYDDNDTIDNAVKITVTIENGNNAKKILECIKELVSIYGYVSSKHINIIDDYVNKSSALKYLEDKNLITDINVIGDDINDYEMLSEYDGVIMKKHDQILNSLKKDEISHVYEYLDKKVKKLI